MKATSIPQFTETIRYSVRAQIPPQAVAFILCSVHPAVVEDVREPDWVSRTIAASPGLLGHGEFLKKVGEQVLDFWGLHPELLISTPAIPLTDPEPAPAEPVTEPATETEPQ